VRLRGPRRIPSRLSSSLSPFLPTLPPYLSLSSFRSAFCSLSLSFPHRPSQYARPPGGRRDSAPPRVPRPSAWLSRIGPLPAPIASLSSRRSSDEGITEDPRNGRPSVQERKEREIANWAERATGNITCTRSDADSEKQRRGMTKMAP